MKKTKKLLCLLLTACLLLCCAPLALAAETPTFTDPAEAAEYVRPAVEAHDRLVTLKELKKLPTWSLQAVAEAAAKMPFQTKRYRTIASGLLTEFERRRAKAAGPAKEGV